MRLDLLGVPGESPETSGEGLAAVEAAGRAAARAARRGAASKAGASTRWAGAVNSRRSAQAASTAGAQ